MASADYTSRGAVAVITLNNPPVNALGLNVRKAIADGLERAANAPEIGAVVITGSGAAFCGGADVSRVRLPRRWFAAPNLADLCAQIEELSQAGDCGAQRHRPWAAAWNSRWGAITVSRLPVRRLHCLK